jgi:hypothetical protein
MLKLSEKEKMVLQELESDTLPEVVAIRLNMDPKTLNNYVSKLRKKCFDAAKFLKEMQTHQKILKLRIKVSIEQEPQRKV